MALRQFKSALYAGTHKPRLSRALQLALLAFAELNADQAVDRTDRTAARSRSWSSCSD